ncbi:MAG: DNA polymerase III subunit delta [Chthoniobacteraceae bacterium]
MAAAKTKAQAQIHAILGSDDGEVKRVARDLAMELTPEGGGDFACDTIDGAVQYADDAATRIHATVEALLTFPFFGGEKLVWLKSVNFLADDQLGRSQAVVEALEKLAETLSAGLPESTRFLLSAVGVDKRRTFYKTLTRLAKVQVFDKVDASKAGWEEEAAELVDAMAREHGLSLTMEAAELFVLLTGGERRVIENELVKLDLYLGPERRKVAIDDVRLLVPLSRAGIVFEIGNAIAERDLSRALGLLDQLLFQGETPIGIMYAAIIPTVRNLLVVKDLMTRHRLSKPAQPFFFGKTLERLPAEAVAHLPRKKDGGINAFALGLAAIHAHRYEVGELREALDTCLEANIQLVSSSLDAEVALSQLLVKIIAPAGRVAL